MKAILINNVVNYPANIMDSDTKKLFGINIDGFSNSNNATLLKLGFKDIPEQTILDTQVFGDWYETENQILRHIIDKTPGQITQEKKDVQNNKIELLEVNGIDVEFDNNIFHFTRETANQLLGSTQLMEKLNFSTVEWKNNEDIFVELSLDKAYNICALALKKFIEIHKEN